MLDFLNNFKVKDLQKSTFPNMFKTLGGCTQKKDLEYKLQLCLTNITRFL